MRQIYQTAFAAYDAENPLPSWKGPSRAAILDFVKSVSEEGSQHFVAPAQRIAVFDNDGTLWCEQPVPIQVQFAVARFAKMVKDNPELASNDALKAGAAGDYAGLLKHGTEDALNLVLTTHTNLTPREFEDIASAWYYAAENPVKPIPVRNLVYLPMLELLVYLEKNGFTNYIASAGGQDFMRAISEDRYGVPPERVIGTQFKTAYELRNGEMQIVRKPELLTYDDKVMKPINIQHAIGRRPIFAFGNSDGDYQMLEWVSNNTLPHMGLLLHHTDAAREWAYDTKAVSGVLVEALKDAPKFGWHVVDMAKEWSTIFAE